MGRIYFKTGADETSSISKISATWISVFLVLIGIIIGAGISYGSLEKSVAVNTDVLISQQNINEKLYDSMKVISDSSLVCTVRYESIYDSLNDLKGQIKQIQDKLD